MRPECSLTYALINKKVSAPLVSFTTQDGKTHSLIPHPNNRWFQPNNGGLNCLFGTFMNEPNMKEPVHQKTLPIVSVTTSTCEKIYTMLELATAPEHETAPQQKLSLAQVTKEIFTAMLTDRTPNLPQPQKPPKKAFH